VPYKAIRDILGATGEGRKERSLDPGFPLSYIKYLFNEYDKDVRAWLLLHAVLKDPLDL